MVRPTNNITTNLTKLEINTYLMSKQHDWARHVWRSNGILKEVLEGEINGKRTRDYPKQRWADGVVANLNWYTQGVTIADSIDRDRWRNVVEEANILQGL